MKPRTFNVVAGTMFLIIALVHAWRLLAGWTAVINGWTVPQAVSWVAIGVFGALASAAFRLARSGR